MYFVTAYPHIYQFKLVPSVGLVGTNKRFGPNYKGFFPVEWKWDWQCQCHSTAEADRFISGMFPIESLVDNCL